MSIRQHGRAPARPGRAMKCEAPRHPLGNWLSRILRRMCKSTGAVIGWQTNHASANRMGPEKGASKRRRSRRGEMRREYQFDYRKLRPNRFPSSMRSGTAAIVLDPDVASVFLSHESVNAPPVVPRGKRVCLWWGVWEYLRRVLGRPSSRQPTGRPTDPVGFCKGVMERTHGMEKPCRGCLPSGIIPRTSSLVEFLLHLRWVPVGATNA